MSTLTLFLAWQEPRTRAWYPVGRLAYDGEKYQFVYTVGARAAQRAQGFQPLPSFPDLEQIYESDEFFPLFANRLLPRSTAEYADFVKWLDLPQHQDDPIALLARSGGRQATDTFEVFPSPEPDESGQYHIHFFAHGLRHLPGAAIERIHRLQPDQPLMLIHDFQNPADSRALMLRTEDCYNIGYCPRYLLDDLFKLITRDPHLLHVAVERVNLPPAPLQLRLLCNLTARWPDGFEPFADEMYQPLTGKGR